LLGGVVLAVYNDAPHHGTPIGYGLALGNGGAIISEGSPTNLNHIVYYNAVQEQASDAWDNWNQPYSFQTLAGLSSVPTAYFRFTDWALPGGNGGHLNGHKNTAAAFTLVDCRFSGGQIVSTQPSCYVTNCLFERVNVDLEDSDSPNGGVTINGYNNLFWNGSLSMIHQRSSSAFTFRNNAFDHTVNSVSGSVVGDHNGYIGGAATIGSGGSDVTLSSLTYAAGPLGAYYQFPGSSLYGAGSASAAALGLYHYTAQAGQQKAGAATVSIGLHYVAMQVSVLTLDISFPISNARLRTGLIFQLFNGEAGRTGGRLHL